MNTIRDKITYKKISIEFFSLVIQLHSHFSIARKSRGLKSLLQLSDITCRLTAGSNLFLVLCIENEGEVHGLCNEVGSSFSVFLTFMLLKEEQKDSLIFKDVTSTIMFCMCPVFKYFVPNFAVYLHQNCFAVFPSVDSRL